MATDINDKPMSIGEHLEELRKRLWLAIVGVVPIFCIGLYFGKDIMQFILEPLIVVMKKEGEYSGTGQATAVLEGFMNYLKIALVLAIVVGGPWIVYHLWKFIAPGLYAREKRFFYILSPLSVVFSALGLAFMYYVMLPMVLTFFVHFNANLLKMPPTPTIQLPPGTMLQSLPEYAGDPKDPRSGQMWLNTDRGAIRVAMTNPKGATPEERAKLPPLVLSLPLHSDSFVAQHYRIGEYVSLVLTFAIAFVLTFQMPVVVLLLGWVGIINPKTIGKQRKWVFFGCTIISGIVTPADLLSMFLLMVPMYLLFEVGILLLRIMPASRVASGRILKRGTETRDGAGGGGDDATAQSDDR